MCSGQQPLSADLVRFASTMDQAQAADHRIANNLTMLAGFARVEVAKLQKGPARYSRDEVALILERLRAQIDAAAYLHRSLALQPGRSVDLAEHLRRTSGAIALAHPGRVILDHQLEDGLRVAPDVSLALAQVVAEALLNAIKHAKPPGEWVRLGVRCWRDRRGSIGVEVADDGRGLRGPPPSSSSLGLRLIDSLARKANGRAQFISDAAGLRVQVLLEAPSACLGCAR